MELENSNQLLSHILRSITTPIERFDIDGLMCYLMTAKCDMTLKDFVKTIGPEDEDVIRWYSEFNNSINQGLLYIVFHSNICICINVILAVQYFRQRGWDINYNIRSSYFCCNFIANCLIAILGICIGKDIEGKYAYLFAPDYTPARDLVRV
jgi:hypothetical protein